MAFTIEFGQRSSQGRPVGSRAHQRFSDATGGHPDFFIPIADCDAMQQRTIVVGVHPSGEGSSLFAWLGVPVGDTAFLRQARERVPRSAGSMPLSGCRVSDVLKQVFVYEGRPTMQNIVQCLPASFCFEVGHFRSFFPGIRRCEYHRRSDMFKRECHSLLQFLCRM